MEVAARAVRALDEFVAAWARLEELAEPALRLAAEHRVSACDAVYLALARREGSRVATLDGKLAALAQKVGLGEAVLAL